MRNGLNTEIGKRVRFQREKMGYSREDLSELIEISSRFLADIELGAKGMSFQTLIRLSRELHVSTDYLLFGAREDNDNAAIHTLIANIDKQFYPELEQLLLAYQRTIQKSKK